MKVRALQTIKRGSRWHVPGTDSEIFDITEIEAERYRGSVHILGSSELAAPAETTLPDDTPYYALLVSHGLTTVEAVEAVGDLRSLKGIGPKSASAIRDFLRSL